MQGTAASPRCCGREDDSVLGRWVPIPARGLSLAPLRCSKTVTTMFSSAIHSGLPSSKPTRWPVDAAYTFPRWRFLKIAGSQCCPVSSVVTSRRHLSWHTSSSGLPGPMSHQAGAHHQHTWLQSSQVNNNVRVQPVSAPSCQLCQVPGQLSRVPRPAATSLWGHLAPAHVSTKGGPLGDDAAALWAAGAAPAAATSPATPLMALGWLFQGDSVEGGG